MNIHKEAHGALSSFRKGLHAMPRGMGDVPLKCTLLCVEPKACLLHHGSGEELCVNVHRWTVRGARLLHNFDLVQIYVFDMFICLVLAFIIHAEGSMDGSWRNGDCLTKIWLFLYLLSASICCSCLIVIIDGTSTPSSGFTGQLQHHEWVSTQENGDISQHENVEHFVVHLSP